MGHPIKERMTKSVGKELEVGHEITVIDLLEQEPEAPMPISPMPAKKPAFETFQVGNMVLKVRND